MRGMSVEPAALGMIVLSISSASAQTRQETLDIIFGNSFSLGVADAAPVEFSNFFILPASGMAAGLTVSEKDCVVTLTASYTSGPGKATEYAKIDFNHLNVSAPKYDDHDRSLTLNGENGGLEISHNDPAEKSATTHARSDRLEILLVDSPARIERVRRALSYFAANFCKGKAGL